MNENVKQGSEYGHQQEQETGPDKHTPFIEWPWPAHLVFA